MGLPQPNVSLITFFWLDSAPFATAATDKLNIIAKANSPTAVLNKVFRFFMMTPPKE